MFDRSFFERQFHDQAKQFCREQNIAALVVELLLDDGTMLHLRSITQIRESWLGLSTHGEGGKSRLILCPYFTIKRITFSAPSGAKDAVFSLTPNP
jgi:hypothetical protein